jgi:hypothetical protein
MTDEYMDVENPFPFTTITGKTVIDEYCVCGFKRSEHSHTFQWGHGAVIDAELGVVCPKFTWKSWIIEGEDDEPDSESE